MQIAEAKASPKNLLEEVLSEMNTVRGAISSRIICSVQIFDARRVILPSLII